jgi:hypothetical protein
MRRLLNLCRRANVSHEQTLQGWFVMVKESKDTHPDNKLWGDGWAWSWFDAEKSTKTTSTDYKKGLSRLP